MAQHGTTWDQEFRVKSRVSVFSTAHSWSVAGATFTGGSDLIGRLSLKLIRRLHWSLIYFENQQHILGFSESRGDGNAKFIVNRESVAEWNH